MTNKTKKLALDVAVPSASALVVSAILWLLATHDAGVVRAAEDKHRDQKIEEAKSDVATVRAEVSQYHDNLNSKLDKITDDVAYIRGRIDK